MVDDCPPLQPSLTRPKCPLPTDCLRRGPLIGKKVRQDRPLPSVRHVAPNLHQLRSKLRLTSPPLRDSCPTGGAIVRVSEVPTRASSEVVPSTAYSVVATTGIAPASGRPINDLADSSPTVAPRLTGIVPTPVPSKVGRSRPSSSMDLNRYFKKGPILKFSRVFPVLRTSWRTMGKNQKSQNSSSSQGGLSTPASGLTSSPILRIQKKSKGNSSFSDSYSDDWVKPAGLLKSLQRIFEHFCSVCDGDLLFNKQKDPDFFYRKCIPPFVLLNPPFSIILRCLARIFKLSRLGDSISFTIAPYRPTDLSLSRFYDLNLTFVLPDKIRFLSAQSSLTTPVLGCPVPICVICVNLSGPTIFVDSNSTDGKFCLSEVQSRLVNDCFTNFAPSVFSNSHPFLQPRDKLSRSEVVRGIWKSIDKAKLAIKKIFTD